MKAGRPAYHIRAKWITLVSPSGSLVYYELDKKGNLVHKKSENNNLHNSLADFSSAMQCQPCAQTGAVHGLADLGHVEKKEIKRKKKIETKKETENGSIENEDPFDFDEFSFDFEGNNNFDNNDSDNDHFFF